MTKIWDLVTLAAATGCGLVAGVLFAFSSFVMPGLTRLPPAQGLAAMQSINVTAVRPLFMSAFFGTALACVALVVRAITTWGERSSVLTLVAAALYLVGTVGLTAAYHVPLNDRLATVHPAAADAPQRWHDYAGAWTTANHVRTLTALAAMVVLVLALVVQGRSTQAAAQAPSRVTNSV